jgi:hypothetical protein
MFAGGVIRWLVERRFQSQARSLAEIESGPGVLYASGMIAGGAIGGIAIAAIAGKFGSADKLSEIIGLAQRLGHFSTDNLLAVLLFVGMGYVLYRVGLRRQ